MLSRVVVAFALCLVTAAPVRSAAERNIQSTVLQSLVDNYITKSDVARFWSEVRKRAAEGGYPIVEETGPDHISPDDYVRITFLYDAEGRQPDNVLLFANINHVLAQELLFTRLEGTNIFYKSVEVPRGVRFEYRIIENDPLTGIFAGAKYGTRMHLLDREADPLNPNRKVHKDGLGAGKDYIEAWVELPGAAPQPYIVDRNNPRGEVTTEEHIGNQLPRKRTVTTYLPAGYNRETVYPLMILFDASSYFAYGSFATTLDNLIADGSIPPIIVLGVDAGYENGQNRRNEEFTCNAKFKSFLVDELLPWFEGRYRVSRDPMQRVIAGSSFGGLCATYVAFDHSDVVANVLSQSGSFHWGRQEDAFAFEWLPHEFAFSNPKPIAIYMEVGRLEGEYAWYNPNFPHQILSHRHFKTILDMKGYDVLYHEYAGGHEMLSWRGGIADGLIHLLGK